jgi:hypothetical protein
MDPVIQVQYDRLVSAMDAQGIGVTAVLDEAGNPECIYREQVALTCADQAGIDRIHDHLGGRVEVMQGAERRAAPGVTELRMLGRSVPESVALVIAGEAARVARDGDAAPPATRIAPDHVVHICRICPAGEPQLPPEGQSTPFPPVQVGEAGAGVRVGVCDTGLLRDIAVDHEWLAGVTGEEDCTPPDVHDGAEYIGKYAGHGTFVAGVLRAVAPRAEVVVANHMQTSEAALESVFCNSLTRLVQAGAVPDILVLSAGTYTCGDVPPVAFEHFHKTVLQQNPSMVLIAAAGNNESPRPFWPAASDWAIGVGALDRTESERASFSSFGPCADVYVLGQELINAFPKGRYFYDEIQLGTIHEFTGMAMWDGTSFATPLFAALVAAQMTRTGQSAPDAVKSLLAVAGDATHVIPGVGPALRWQEHV